MDDAAVVRPDGATRSMVLTMDVITPIVDDPHAFGAIAACNAISDVYAMGGRPEVSLTFLGMPTEVLGEEIIGEVLAGVHDVCGRAGCAVVGGHTMKDSEPKCGLSVVGSVEPDAVWSQKFAKPGDQLILTKPIGTGLVGQSVRSGEADPAALEQAVAQMTSLNDVACEVGREHGAHACTDITGFGLLGHLRNLVEASGVTVEIQSGAVPTFPGVDELAETGCVPGGSRRNLTFANAVTDFDETIGEPLRIVLADAQTSGGLLLAFPSEVADAALASLHDRGVTAAAIVGAVTASGEPRVLVKA
jgi:selenide,water dikinase